MPELGILRQVHQGTIRILGVSSGVLRPARIETAIIRWEGDPYEGPYTVKPEPWLEQTLATKHKTMRDDVTVLEIPYYETTNPQGGSTVYIGE